MSEPEIILDRSTYKAVKAMDRQKMEQWINNVYISGLNDASGDGVSLEELQNTIAKVDGIDETRLKAIMTAIGELYKSKKQK
ncbi:MAG: hypothetical protein PUA51_07655 [Oscillospiraceae bacterium]|nr:hypothetical protein [Oscillospiraceae bacterium]